MDVGDVKAADPEHAGASVAVIGQNARLRSPRAGRRPGGRASSSLGVKRDLAVLSEHEPSGVSAPPRWQARSGSRSTAPAVPEDRLARFQPDQADQAEPALGLSQFGVSIPNPVGMFFVERGHGGRGGCLPEFISVVPQEATVNGRRRMSR